MNSVIMIGRLTKDPELRFIAGSGKAVCNFSIAVNREFSKEKEADFFRVVVWGKQAENAANYLAKGRLVGIKGSLLSRSYDDKNGNKKYITEIVANSVEFLEWGDKKDTTDSNFSEKHNENEDFQTIEDDDIPF